MAEQTKDDVAQGDNAQTETTETTEQSALENKVSVTETGKLKKTVTVTIPRQAIDAKRDEMFGELSTSAQVPGFRIGRAPKRLLEKRFGKEVARDVRNALLGESIGGAIEKSELNVLGEPDLDMESIEVPEEGDLEFSFDVEVAPDFDLPELKGIEVTKPILKITEKRINDQLAQWVQTRARYEETDLPGQEGDMVTAGATIRITGIEEPVERPGLTLRVAAGQIEGIPLIDLGKALAGKKAGQTAKLTIKIPDAHPEKDWRGKEASIEIDLSQVRRRVLPEINEDFAASSGFDSLQDLREFTRNRLEINLNIETRRALREQIHQHLLDNTKFDLPEGVLERHTVRLLQRREMELLSMGVPREQADEQLVELRAGATEQATRDLKVQFIVEKISEQQEIKVSAEEINARVAQMASMQNRRPERLRQELAANGTLEQLAFVVLEEKTTDKLLEDAKVEEVKDEEPTEQKAKKKAKAKKTTKKAVKKASKKTAKKSEKKTTKKASKKTK